MFADMNIDVRILDVCLEALGVVVPAMTLDGPSGDIGANAATSDSHRRDAKTADFMTGMFA